MTADPVIVDSVLDRAGWIGDGHREPIRTSEPAPTIRPSLNVKEFLDEPEPEYDWIVPGLVERGDRVILTGGEGDGKSTLLRQNAVQYASGIHPFGGPDFVPARVMLIDLENGRRHLRRQLRPLYLRAGAELDPDRLRIISSPAGVNLLEPKWREWLFGRCEANEPDLVVIGPIYKMAEGDPTSEEVARIVAGTLDIVRSKYNAAVFVEAHSPYATSGGKRPMRPYGASLWSRWPEFGLHLGNDGQLKHWRGARDEREWPAMLQRGGEWPFTVATDTRKMTFARILEIERDRGQPMSSRNLGAELGVGKSTVERAIAANKSQHDALIEELTS